MDEEERSSKKNWFETNLARDVSDKKESLFWEDRWLEGRSLKNLYPDLYKIARDKKISVRDAIRSESRGLAWNDNWNGNLEEVNEMRVAKILYRIQRIPLKDNINDKWKWYKNVYMVKEAYS